MEILAQNWEMLSLTFLFVKLWVHFSAKPSDHWPDAVRRFLFVFVGCNQSGQLLTMDQLLRAATQRNRQIFLRRNCYNALQRVSHFQTKIQTLFSEQLPGVEFRDWFLPGKSFCLDHGHSSTIKGTQRFEPGWELSKTPLYCCIIVIKTTTITISSFCFCLSCPAPALLGVNLSLAKLASSSISSKPISHLAVGGMSKTLADCLIFDRFWIISPSVLSSKTTNACIFTITHWQSR